MPVYLLTGPVVPNLWVTMYRINNSLATIIARVWILRKKTLTQKFENSRYISRYIHAERSRSTIEWLKVRAARLILRFNERSPRDNLAGDEMAHK